MKKLLLLGILSLLIFSFQVSAQVGKITGSVRDATTKEALIGANIIVEGKTYGAATNIDAIIFQIAECQKHLIPECKHESLWLRVACRYALHPPKQSL